MYRRNTITLAATLFFLVHAAYGWNDRVIYDTTGHSKCREVTARATRDCRWHAGLYRHADETILGGTIAAYKLQWSGGSWSGWFVPGVNDIDMKFNTFARRCDLPLKVNSMRRQWSYFYDHNHRYIICKNL